MPISWIKSCNNYFTPITTVLVVVPVATMKEWTISDLRIAIASNTVPVVTAWKYSGQISTITWSSACVVLLYKKADSYWCHVCNGLIIW